MGDVLSVTGSDEAALDVEGVLEAAAAGGGGCGLAAEGLEAGWTLTFDEEGISAWLVLPPAQYH